MRKEHPVPQRHIHAADQEVGGTLKKGFFLATIQLAIVLYPKNGNSFKKRFRESSGIKIKQHTEIMLQMYKNINIFNCIYKISVISNYQKILY